MKFLYADSVDVIDPNYNFLEDRSAPDKKPYWDEEYPHEYLGEAPFDGILISRGIVGDHKLKGKYTESQCMRFRRDGARKFVRLEAPEFRHLDIFGDCGAFTYVDHEKPPYTTNDILEFYEDGGFSHGCSVDHVIFEFERGLKGAALPENEKTAKEVKRRQEITIENAKEFHAECRHLSNDFTPLGVVQGWSPDSMADAASKLEKIGYDYLAIGGMVPLGGDTIIEALTAIRAKIQSHVKLHILGFGKVDQIHDFLDFGIASVDNTSPMRRAFKDSKNNFFMPSTDTKLKYYTAIRIPQVTENRALQTLAKKGHFTQENLRGQEQEALLAVRERDKGAISVDDALVPIMTYTHSHLINPKNGKEPPLSQLDTIEEHYRRMLTDQPWKVCPCRVCQRDGVEAAIFRASNRNKRRGIHNMWVFNKQLKRLIGQEVDNSGNNNVYSNQRAAE